MVAHQSLKLLYPSVGGGMGSTPIWTAKYNSMEEKIKTQFKCALITLDSTIKMVEENKLVNEQWFLDYMDELNKLSVKY